MARDGGSRPVERRLADRVGDHARAPRRLGQRTARSMLARTGPALAGSGPPGMRGRRAWSKHGQGLPKTRRRLRERRDRRGAARPGRGRAAGPGRRGPRRRGRYGAVGFHALRVSSPPMPAGSPMVSASMPVRPRRNTGSWRTGKLTELAMKHLPVGFGVQRSGRLDIRRRREPRSRAAARLR